MIDIVNLLGNISQEQMDDWLSCNYRLSDIVRQNLKLAKTFKRDILNGLNQYTPEDAIRLLEQNRPDLRIADRQKAINKLREEFNTIGTLLS